jgi:hypothetical protein
MAIIPVKRKKIISHQILRVVVRNLSKAQILLLADTRSTRVHGVQWERVLAQNACRRLQAARIQVGGISTQEGAVCCKFFRTEQVAQFGFAQTEHI